MQMQQNVEEIQQAAANSYQYPVLASTENLTAAIRQVDIR